MLDSLTPDSIFSSILMEESDPEAYLLVEGPDDSAVFFGHLRADILLIICGSKSTVIGAVGISKDAGLGNVFGLVDNDFDDLLGVARQHSDSIVYTESYDLVADIVAQEPGALRRVLSAHSEKAVRNIEASCRTQIDEVLFAITERVAAVRLVAMRHEYPIVLKKYGFAGTIAADFSPVSYEEFLNAAKVSDPVFVRDDTVLQNLMSEAAHTKGVRKRTGGHDLVNAGLALLKAAGDTRTSRDALEASMIAIATCGAMSGLASVRRLSALAADRISVTLFDCVDSSSGISCAA